VSLRMRSFECLTVWGFVGVVCVIGSDVTDTESLASSFAFDKFLLLPLCMIFLKLTIVYLLQVFVALIEMK